MNRNPVISRLLLTLAAAIFLLGALMHAIAFTKASSLLGASTLKTFFSGELRALWLADSTTLLGLALVFALIAARPTWASRPLILASSWIPAATTALLYVFLGPFYAAHMLLAATLMVIVSGLLLPQSASHMAQPMQLDAQADA